MMAWEVTLRGGAYDGMELDAGTDLKMVLIVWTCGRDCAGHGTFDPQNPAIVLAGAEAYRLADEDPEAMTAIYDVGEEDPAVQRGRELVGAGVGPNLSDWEAMAHAKVAWERYRDSVAPWSWETGGG